MERVSITFDIWMLVASKTSPLVYFALLMHLTHLIRAVASARPSRTTGRDGKLWGKGLVEKGKGKGLSTNGGQKGDSRGVKGSGKGGFKESCFRCGQQEHRANECWNHSANAVEEEDEEEAVPLAGALMVGAVDEYEDEKTWVMVKDKWLAKSVNAKQNVEVRNRFEVLAVETNKAPVR